MGKFRIRRINGANWEAWDPYVLHHMRRAFPRKLWWGRADFESMFAEDRYIARLATLGDEFVGLTFGIRASEGIMKLCKFPEDCNAMQLYYLFVVPSMRGQGYGFRMRMDFIEHAKSVGYGKLCSNAKPGPSLHNVLKSGAKAMKRMRNFFDTGQTYVLCAQDL